MLHIIRLALLKLNHQPRLNVPANDLNLFDEVSHVFNYLELGYCLNIIDMCMKRLETSDIKP